jgi:hypothetical protein
MQQQQQAAGVSARRHAFLVRTMDNMGKARDLAMHHALQAFVEEKIERLQLDSTPHSGHLYKFVWQRKQLVLRVCGGFLVVKKQPKKATTTTNTKASDQ